MGPKGSSGNIKDAAIDFSAGSLGTFIILKQQVLPIQYKYVKPTSPSQ